MAYNPLFLYGGVGLGKTHLMHAIGQRVLRATRNANIVYVSSEKFTNEFIIAIKNNQTVEFRNRYRHVDVLLIDDIQFLEGKEQTQEEFFHTFNSLARGQTQLVISSDRPPKEIQTLEIAPALALRVGAAHRHPAARFRDARGDPAQERPRRRHVPVPDDVTLFIAKVIPSNIRELEGSLIRVVAFASLDEVADHGRPRRRGPQERGRGSADAPRDDPADQGHASPRSTASRSRRWKPSAATSASRCRARSRCTSPGELTGLPRSRRSPASSARRITRRRCTRATRSTTSWTRDEAFRNRVRTLIAQIQSE